MTERKGGSDVGKQPHAEIGTCTSFVLLLGGGTDTVAKGPLADDSYLLYGYKWFSSATDAQVAFTLARIMDSEESVTKVNYMTVLSIFT